MPKAPQLIDKLIAVLADDYPSRAQIKSYYTSVANYGEIQASMLAFGQYVNHQIALLKKGIPGRH